MHAINTPEARSMEHRASARFDTVLPVDMDGSEGWTRNISATGICFDTDRHQQVGSTVHLEIAFMRDGKRQHLRCEGKVVRVDALDDRVCIAAELLTPFFAS